MVEWQVELMVEGGGGSMKMMVELRVFEDIIGGEFENGEGLKHVRYRVTCKCIFIDYLYIFVIN